MYLFVSAAPFYEMEKNCNIEIAAQIARVSSSSNGTWLSYLPFTFDTTQASRGTFFSGSFGFHICFRIHLFHELCFI